jgi:predicted AAA+ superfamily ATPase
MIQRTTYFDQIKKFIDKPQVKIITGIRRSGKSTILRLLKNELIESGIDCTQIISINFESFAFADYTNAKALHDYVSKLITKQNRYYLLLDEIQEVNDWEKTINSFIVDFDIDIYITGSNSQLLSSELATYIAGRYVEIPIFTLSFSEFLKFTEFYKEKSDDEQKNFLKYLRLGGFPVIHAYDYNEEEAYKVVRDIYSSVLLKDTVQRYNIRDVELLERVIRFAFNNVGNTFSGKNVADYFKSQQRKVDVNTIYNYLNALVGAFVLFRVPRYDVKGKDILKTQEKYYVGDLSLIYATLGNRDEMISGFLENLVFLELKRRHYEVYVGKIEKKEIDFIATKRNEKIYIQVTYKLENSSTVQREFGVFSDIKDSYPKYVISMDDFWKENLNGVKHLHVIDFLMGSL